MLLQAQQASGANAIGCSRLRRLLLGSLPGLLRSSTSVELGLLLGSLEAAVAQLGGGVDELQLHLLSGPAADLRQERLPQGDDALAGAHDGALDHHPVLVHLTVVGEATHGGDALLGLILLGHGALGVLLRVLAHSVPMLVDLGSVMVASLTRARHLELDSRRMPGADARHLAEASVGLAHQAGHTPA